MVENTYQGRCGPVKHQSSGWDEHTKEFMRKGAEILRERAEGYSAVQAARQLVVERERQPMDWAEFLREMARRGQK